MCVGGGGGDTTQCVSVSASSDWSECRRVSANAAQRQMGGGGVLKPGGGGGAVTLDNVRVHVVSCCDNVCPSIVGVLGMVLSCWPQ